MLENTGIVDLRLSLHLRYIKQSAGSHLSRLAHHKQPKKTPTMSEEKTWDSYSTSSQQATLSEVPCGNGVD